MPRTWADGGVPALSAANLNALESELAAALNPVVSSTKTGNYTLTSTDQVVMFDAVNPTATLPDPTTVTNKRLTIKNLWASGTVTVVSAGTSKLIDKESTIYIVPFGSVSFQSNGTAWYAVDGGEMLQASGHAPKLVGSDSGTYPVLTLRVNTSNTNDLLEVQNASGNKVLRVDKGGYIRSLQGQTSVIGTNPGSPEGGAEFTAEFGLCIGNRASTGSGLWYKASRTDNTGWHPVNDSLALSTKTANFTIGGNDSGIVVFNGTSLTATLPDPTTAIHNGRLFRIKNIHSTSLTVVSAGTSKTIDGAASQSLAQWASIKAVSDGAQWLIV